MGASKRRKTVDRLREGEGRGDGSREGGGEGSDFPREGRIDQASAPMHLNQGEAVVVVGRGALVVLRGRVKVHGKVLQGEEDGSVRLPLACDAAFPVCIQSLGGLETEGQGIPYAAARYAEIVLEGVDVEHVPEAFDHFFPAEWTEVADDIAREAESGRGPFQTSTGTSTSNARKTSNATNTSNDMFVAVVCGSKNTGKSSFGRYLVNTLLNVHESVLYLDTDCGQPEYTPPGLVSLFEVTEPMIEPTYMTRYVRPVASHFIGDTSPGSDPALYEQSVANLFGTWGLRAPRGSGVVRPARAMVINTHGWIQGLGLDVLCRFLEKVVAGTRRVALVRMQADNPRHNLPDGLFFRAAGGDDHEARGEFHLRDSHVRDYHLPAISSACPSTVAARRVRETWGFARTMKQANTNATERRTMQWHNFARHCAIDHNNKDEDEGTTLFGQRPYRIGLDAVTLSFFEGFEPEDADRAMQCVNGCAVGLCDSVSLPLPVCYGMGIVRSVCARTRSLYVVTPVPLEVLETHVDRIVVGRRCDLPNSLLGGSPYLATGCIGGGGGHVRSSRGNLVREKALVDG